MKLFRVEMRHRSDGWSRAAKVAAIPHVGDSVVSSYDIEGYKRVYTVCHVQHVLDPENCGDFYISAVIWIDDEIVAE